MTSFVTFTGVDERTNLNRCRQIAARWPVEFALLFSRSKQGTAPRYPDADTITAFLWADFLPRRAAHLCGAYSRAVMSGENPQVGADLGYLNRVQVNHPSPDAAAIRRYAKGWGVRGIAQCRDSFPANTEADWLFDCSGGRGVSPEAWPPHAADRLVGFAGGITPENITAVAASVTAVCRSPFWLDMESGVRTDDWLDLDKCEAVCRSVFDGEDSAALDAPPRAQKEAEK